MATLGLFFGGLAVLALFVFVEQRAEDPVVPLDLFSERIIAVSAFGTWRWAVSCSASRSTCRSSYKAPSAELRSRPAPP